MRCNRVKFNNILLGIFIIFFGIGNLVITPACIYFEATRIDCLIVEANFFNLNNIFRRIRNDLIASEEILEQYLSEEEKFNFMTTMEQFDNFKEDALKKVVELVKKIEASGIMEIGELDRNSKDIRDILLLIPEIAELSEYSLSNFETAMEEIFPLPANAVKGLLNKSSHCIEFVRYLIDAKKLIEEYSKPGRRISWQEVDKIYIKVFFEVAGWELGLPAFNLRPYIELKERFKSFAGKQLRSPYEYYGDIWRLREDIEILPENTQEWIELVRFQETRWQYMPKSVREDFFTLAFAEKHPELWEATPEDERFAVRYYARREEILESPLKFLDGKSMRGLLRIYDWNYTKLRKDLHITAQNVEELVMILKKMKVVREYGINPNYIRYDDIDQKVKWQLFNLAVDERMQQGVCSDPEELTESEFRKPFDFLDGENLSIFFKLYPNYQTFKEEMITKQWEYWLTRLENEGIEELFQELPKWIVGRLYDRAHELLPFPEIKEIDLSFLNQADKAEIILKYIEIAVLSKSAASVFGPESPGVERIGLETIREDTLEKFSDTVQSRFREINLDIIQILTRYIDYPYTLSAVKNAQEGYANLLLLLSDFVNGYFTTRPTSYRREDGYISYTFKHNERLVRLELLPYRIDGNGPFIKFSFSSTQYPTQTMELKIILNSGSNQIKLVIENLWLEQVYSFDGRGEELKSYILDVPELATPTGFQAIVELIDATVKEIYLP